METSQQLQANSHPKELRCTTTNKSYGLNNWILLFFVIFCSNYVFENIMAYGIIKNPIELTYDFIEFMQVNWWYYVVMFLGYLAQIILCFLNEKLLAMGILSEKIGMALHLFISLLSYNLCSILCIVYKFNPVAGIVAMSHLMVVTVKCCGYANTNRKLREDYKRTLFPKNRNVNGKANSENEAIAKKTLKYPKNLTLNGIFQFMVCTGSSNYRINGPSSKPTNFKKVLTGILRAIVISYAVAFLFHQYLFPELNKAVSYIDQRQYLNVFGSILKLALPVDIAWLLFFYFYCFEFYLPAFGWFWGTEDITFAEDWWNSENSSIFWIKWNHQVHTWLKECFFIPILQMGYSKRTAALAVCCISGILHEYLLSIPFRCCYGIPTLVLLAQIPLAQTTTYVQKKYGDSCGNLVLWSSLIFGHASCALLVFYNFPS